MAQIVLEVTDEELASFKKLVEEQDADAVVLDPAKLLQIFLQQEISTNIDCYVEYVLSETILSEILDSEEQACVEFAEE